jgi:hypothetical protein
MVGAGIRSMRVWLGLTRVARLLPETAREIICCEVRWTSYVRTYESYRFRASVSSQIYSWVTLVAPSCTSKTSSPAPRKGVKPREESGQHVTPIYKLHRGKHPRRKKIPITISNWCLSSTAPRHHQFHPYSLITVWTRASRHLCSDAMWLPRRSNFYGCTVKSTGVSEALGDLQPAAARPASWHL